MVNRGTQGLTKTTFTPRMIGGKPSQAIDAWRCEHGLVLHQELPRTPPPWCRCAFVGLGWCISDPETGLRFSGPHRYALEARRAFLASVDRVASATGKCYEAVIEDNKARARRMAAIDQAALDLGEVLTLDQIAERMIAEDDPEFPAYRREALA